MKEFSKIYNKYINPLDEGLLDDEDELIGGANNMIELPIRIAKYEDKYSQSLSFSHKCRVSSSSVTNNPISVDGDLLRFVNPYDKVGSVLLFKEIKDFTKEFKISGFEAPAIYFNLIPKCDNLKDKVGNLISNNIHMHICNTLNNVDIELKDLSKYGDYKLYFDNNKEIDYTKYTENVVKGKMSVLVPPCLEIINDEKSSQLELSNWNIKGGNKLTRLLLTTPNKIQLNNFKTKNVQEFIIISKDNSTTNGLSKQLYDLFESNYIFHAWDNKGHDSTVELSVKSLKDIINYYSEPNRYVHYGLELPFKLKDIYLSDILDIRDMIDLKHIIIKYKKVDFIITKDINKAELYWGWQFREAVEKGKTNPPKTKDDWYISFAYFK